MTTPTLVPRPWRLAHRWQSASDLESLAVCADELATAGVAFSHAAHESQADAVKMHAQELVEARRQRRLADLSRVAAAGEWSRRVHPAAWGVMSAGGEVHGIPVAIHRSNVAWASRPVVERQGGLQGVGIGALSSWLRVAGQRIDKPLLVGGRPWEIGVLFESVALCHLDEATWHAAFIRLDPDTLAGPAMIELLQRFGALRDWVDDDRLGQSWDRQFEALAHEEAALMFMGDWARAGLPAHVVRLAVPAPDCLVVDYFVPLRRADADVTHRVAESLASPSFLHRFAAAKGASSPMRAEDEPPAPCHASVPSLAFEQCCGTQVTAMFLKVIADHFLHWRPAIRTASLLADIAAG